MRARQTKPQAEDLLNGKKSQRPMESAQASAFERHAPVESLLHMQRSYGNQFVQRVLSTAIAPHTCNCGGTCGPCSSASSLPDQVTVSQPGDAHEQEADRVADHVMGMATPAPHSPDDEQNGLGVDQAMPIPDETEDEADSPPPATAIAPASCHTCHGPEELDEVNRKPTSLGEILNPVVPLAPGAGQAMDRTLRNYFEPRFGHSFDRVRLHTDERANVSARSLSARAYTLGADIVFGAGEYQPETTEGRRLIAHELTHVIQQGKTPTVNRKVKPSFAFPDIQFRGTGNVIHRWVIGTQADPGTNTIICDGAGGVTTQTDGTGDAEQTACLGDCIRKHEESHRADALAANANICKGQVKGLVPSFSNNGEQKASEVKASNVEIDCLKSKLKWTWLPWNKKCVPAINARVTQMEQYRDSF